MTQTHGRSRRGQALVEMAIAVPVIVMLMLGAADLGRAFYMSIEMSGASRAGMRAGINGQGIDLGSALRNEVFSTIDNTTAVWGDTGPGGTYDRCGTAGGTCGDPTGCSNAVFTGNRVACFAVRDCTLTSGIATCPSSWGSRPGSGSYDLLQVRVVYIFKPITPIIAAFTGANGALYLTSDTYGLELY